MAKKNSSADLQRVYHVTVVNVQGKTEYVALCFCKQYAELVLSSVGRIRGQITADYMQAAHVRRCADRGIF